MKKAAYNPFKFIPYFKIEEKEIALDGDTITILNSEKNENNNEESNEVKFNISRFQPSKRHHIFFKAFELFFAVVSWLYILYAYLTRATDIYSLFLWIIGMGLAMFLVYKSKFTLSEFVIGLTSIACMVSLYMFFGRIEYIYSHIAIYAISYFLISYVHYNLQRKSLMLKSNTVWAQIASGKFLVIFDERK